MKNEACPLCGNAISTDELKQIEINLSEKYKQAAAKNEKELRESLAEEKKVELAALRAKLEVDSRKQLEDANKQVGLLTRQVADLTALQAKVKQQLEQSAKEKLDLERKSFDLEKKSALAEQRKVLDASNDKKIVELKAEFRQDKAATEKKFLALQRQFEEKNSNQLGDGAEINLYEELRKAFPRDEIEPVTKGTSGADIHHDVMHDGERCGRIVFESKNCQQWRDSFTTKLREDQIASDADHAVLSSTIFPTGHRDLLIRNDVIVVHPARAVYVAELLRKSMIAMSRLCLSEQDRSEKTQQLYEFIKSPQFENRMSQASKYAEDLMAFEVEDKKHFDKMAKKRGGKITDLKNTIRDLEIDLAAILGGQQSFNEVNGQDSTIGKPVQPR